jgi:hypothetical protein
MAEELGGRVYRPSMARPLGWRYRPQVVATTMATALYGSKSIRTAEISVVHHDANRASGIEATRLYKYTFNADTGAVISARVSMADDATAHRASLPANTFRHHRAP